MNVYFIKAGNFVKIGKANDLNERMKDLQTGCPYKLKLLGKIPTKSEEEAFLIEKQLQQKYKDNHFRGEWFEYNDAFLLENYSSFFNPNIKEKGKSLIVQTLFGEEEKFNVYTHPRCYFYPENVANILQSKEKSLNSKVPYRTMEFPTNGKQMLFPFSTELNKVFISRKKHEENIKLNRFKKLKQQSSLEIFLN